MNLRRVTYATAYGIFCKEIPTSIDYFLNAMKNSSCPSISVTNGLPSMLCGQEEYL